MNLNMVTIITGILNAVVTLIVGFVALLIYNTQKNDQKTDAANIILLEIKSAERLIKIVKENLKKDVLPPDILTMQTESWSKYKYLFVRDFDRDEWDEITDFYNKCQSLDQAIIYNSSFFSKNEEQIRVNLLRILADYAKNKNDLLINGNNKSTKKKINQVDRLASMYYSTYMTKPYQLLYNPNKPINDAKLYIDNLKINISQTTIGTKLKALARIKD